MHVKVVEKKEEEKAGIFQRMQYELSKIYNRDGLEEIRIEAFRNLVPFLKKYKAQDIIDIGCGSGNESIFLTKRGFRITSLDAFSEATATVHDRAKKRGLKLNVIRSDAMNLPAQDKKFDAALSLCVLNTFESDERVKAVCEMERVLKPYGLILFLVRADSERYDKTLRIFNDTVVYVVESSSFSEKEVRELFRNFEFLLLKEITTSNDNKFWILIGKKRA